MHCKATAIQFIDGKCYIQKQKSYKTALSGYYTSVSCDLLLMPLRRGHTHIVTHKQKRFQETRHMQTKATPAWFKK